MGLLLPLLLTTGALAQNERSDAPASEESAERGNDAGGGDVFEGEQQAGGKLPPDFIPPAKVPPEMEIEKELIAEDEIKQLKRRLLTGHFRSIVQNGELNGDTRDLVKDGVKYFVYLLSRKDNRPVLHEAREQILRLAQNAARLENNPVLSRQFRNFFLSEIVDRSTELLDGNFHVRLQAVFLLSALNIVEGDPTRGILPEAFAPAAEPLMSIIENESQPLAVKLVAANGLKRIGLYGELDANQKINIAETLIDELEKKEAHWWYQIVVTEALGSIDHMLDLQRKPFIVQALARVMVDEDRHWIVRSTAAKSLGRAKVDGEINLSLLAFEIVRLARQMTEAYQQNPEKFYWRRCYWSLYLAFQPYDASERSRDAGLLQKVQNATVRQHQGVVRQAYRQILPLARKMVNPDEVPRFAQDDLQKLDNWLEQNQPDNFQVAPGLQPITTTEGAQPQPASAG